MIGRAYFNKKEYPKASEYFEWAIVKKQKEAECHFWLGNALCSEAQEANLLRQSILAPKMKNAWEKAIILDKNHLDARVSLIQYYLQAPSFMGRSIAHAKTIAEEILKLNKPIGFRELAEISLFEKNNEAELYHRKMVEADQNHGFLLGNFYVKEKKYAQAFDLYERYVLEDSNDYQAI